jgi:hypothetical protein
MQAAWLDALALSAGVYPRTCPVGAQDVRNMVDAMAKAGMSTVILTYVEYQGGFFYPSGIEFYDRDMKRTAKGNHLSFDLVEALLAQADADGMHVFLGLGRGGDTDLMADIGEPGWDERNRSAVDLGSRVAGELWRRYGKHPSLYGWYLTHESSQIRAAGAYYDPMADALHALTPDKPVMIAPTGAPAVDRDAVERSHVDVFNYQDAVGAGYDGRRYTYDPEKRMAQLDSTYARYRDMHAGLSKHLWADLELWEMDGTQGYAGAYPADFARVRRQLEIESKYVEMVTGYEYGGFLEHPNSRTKLADVRARKLYQDYSAYAGVQ